MSASRLSLLAVLAALLGGGVAVGIAAIAGVGGGSTTTTVIQQSPLTASSKPASDGEALTARDIYRQSAPGVVFITANVTQQSSTPFGFPQSENGVATGSGFVIDKQGTILTNAHVVDGATKVTVRFGDSKLLDAKILGRDRMIDLAVLKVDPKEIDLHPLRLGSAKDVQVGDPVVAIGNPFGLDRTLTTGVVSAKQRQIRGLADFQIDNVIQTDAAINPGNSGGPLIDAAGEVIGINSQIETGTGSSTSGNVGIGFAIPIDTAIRLLPELRKGSVTTGYLGISALSVDETLAGLNLAVKHGALVQSVTGGGPAAKAGIRAGSIPAQVNNQRVTIGGDIIVRIDDRAIRSADDLTAYIARKHKGQEVKVEVVRGGKHRTFTVKLGERPQTTQDSTPSQLP